MHGKDLRGVAGKGRCIWRASAENASMQDFRRLLVWQRAHELVLGVRRAVRMFPRSERGSLKFQMVNAAESIAFNIVEGCGSTSSKEFARFLDISVKSSCELEYQLQLTTDSGLLSDRIVKPLSTETVEVRRMLCGLRKQVIARARRPAKTENHSTTNNSKTAHS
jgi:four helix bundle protein